MCENRPVRNKKNYFSEAILKSAAKKDSYFIFTEDENMLQVYRTIINKIAPEKEVDTVYALGGKKEVLKKFEKWKSLSSLSNNFFFIVDKDFDYWRGSNQVEEDKNLLELPCYTIENLFYTPKTAQIVIKTYNNNLLLEEKYLSIEYWDEWVDSFAESLHRLFIYFAITVKSQLDMPNCGEAPTRYIHYSHIDNELFIKEHEVERYRGSIVNKIGVEKMAEEESFVTGYYKVSDRLDYSSLIKGKYLLFGMLAKIRIILNNKNIHHKEIDNALLNLLVHELPIDYFKCFEKIRYI